MRVLSSLAASFAASFAARVVLALSLAIAVGGALSSACGPSDFDPSTKIQTVRILASRVQNNKSYAKPGDKVTVEVLAYDGRPDTSRKMNVYWIPIPCINPRSDLYYACFAQGQGAVDGGGGDVGSDAGGSQGIPIGGLLKPGIDLTPFLPTGPTFDVTVPADIITSHPPVEGTPDPYGLVIVFNIACAGHVEIVDIDPSTGQQSVPIGCFDEAHNRLGPSDYVIGFTRVYAYADRSNANPVIQDVLSNKVPIPNGDASDFANGLHLSPCNHNCDNVKLNVVVPAASQELNPGDVDPDGVTRKEEIWVDYYTTDGNLDGEARLVYDPKNGAIDGDGADEPYTPPDDPKDGWLFVVVHDNRDGTDWRQIPLHIH